MCGEHPTENLRIRQDLGSSPHVRGTRGTGCTRGFRRGIIPACAGNTAPLLGFGWLDWDHPRMCGEHSGVSCASAWWPGSSPHVRGTRRHPDTARRMGGIIPACAGNTLCHILRSLRSRDHPRMCGEHARLQTGIASAMGSSPHVRGTPNPEWAGGVNIGIIPACAGNTITSRLQISSARDHPRMCGEHYVQAPTRSERMGSSPHVRGTRSPVFC